MFFQSIKNDIKKQLPDFIFLEIVYFKVFHKFFNLSNPKTFNEKLQWLKLNDRNPRYTTLVDKYEVREYIKEKIGEEYLIPLLGVWNTFDEIDFDKLSNQFVLKCTHDSGGIKICTDKRKFDYKEAKKFFSERIKLNYYYSGREWPYKNVKPRIIAEKYMVDESGIELKDYKIFCFNGEPKLIQVDFGRFTEHKRNIYDLNWNLLDLSIQYSNDKKHIIDKPFNLEDMIKLSRILSEGIPHIRVDWYSINGKVYFGELTLYHGNGLEEFNPEIWNLKLGEMINLPRK